MEASERPLPSPAEPWWNTSFMVTFAFRCNLACTFCMVEDALGVFEGTTLDAFKTFVADEARRRAEMGAATRIIFSGGEVTLAKNLLDYVAVARSIPGVEHVRIQTNAVRLADRGYLRSLMDAGIDEYFVSLHAADPELGDALVRGSGAFADAVRALELLAEEGAAVLTNTAIVEQNYSSLPAIALFASRFGPRSIEFWNYWPRADEDGHKHLAARVADVRAPLLEALERCTEKGIAPTVKWFPRCLLGRFALYQDDGQPPALLEDRYWEKEPEYSCIWSGVCEASASCSGLSDAYVRAFGWEENVLAPIRAEGDKGAERRPPQRSLLAPIGPSQSEEALLSAWLGSLGLALERSLGAWRLAEARRAGDGRSVTLVLDRGEVRIGVVIRKSGSGAPAFARTPSFELSYRVFEEAKRPALERVAPLAVEALVRHLGLRDRGELRLP